MEKDIKETKKLIDKVVERLFATRKRAEVILRPHIKNEARFVDEEYWCDKENVDLMKIFPEACEGDACFVSFNVSSSVKTDGYIKITTNTEVFINGVKAEQTKKIESPVKDWDGHEYMYIPVVFDAIPKKIDVKCVCSKEGFYFRYLVATEVYPLMWAKDYLAHIKTTIPIEEFKNEDGIAVSQLFKNNASLEKIKYLFPPESRESNKKTFFSICKNEQAFVGYAYSKAIYDGVLKIKNYSPVKVFINSEITAEYSNPHEFELSLKTGDIILVKSLKTADEWGFECDDSIVGADILQSDRQHGDKWLMIGGFGHENSMELAYGPERELCFDRLYRNEYGDKLFWRLQDGSYVRPTLDSFFFGQWFYALMLGQWGIRKAADYMGKREWQDYFIDSIDILGRWFEYMRYDYEELHITTPFLQRSLNLTHMDPIGTMGMNIADNYLLSGNPQTLNTLYALRDALYNNVPRIENGIINRIETMWADDLFMAVPFIVRLGKIFNDNFYYNDAFFQLKNYYDKMFMKEENLFSHIFYVEEHEMSRVAWGRGNGWVGVAMCEYLDNTPEADENRTEVIKMLKTFTEGIINCQDESGMWHQVLNQPSTYEETSATAMFLYTIVHAVNLGVLDREKTKKTIIKAYEGLCKKSIDSDGNIFGVCMGSGCSKNWKDYATLKTVGNDDHGTGIILAALCEYSRFLNK